MKNNLIKRTLGCVLVGTMVMGSTTGCGNGSNATDASEAKSQTQATTVVETAVMESASAEVVEDINITYPLNEDVTLTIAYTEEGAVTANYKDFTETPFWKAWQEKACAARRHYAKRHRWADAHPCAGSDGGDRSARLGAGTDRGHGAGGSAAAGSQAPPERTGDPRLRR